MIVSAASANSAPSGTPGPAHAPPAGARPWVVITVLVGCMMFYPVIVYGLNERPGLAGLALMAGAVFLAGVTLLSAVSMVWRQDALAGQLARQNSEAAGLRSQIAERDDALDRVAAELRQRDHQVAALQDRLGEQFAAQQRDAAEWHGFLRQFKGDVVSRLEVLDRSPGGGGRDREVLVFTGRRLHALVSRTLQALTEAENQVEDPIRLNELFKVDHLVTLTRREAERYAVLGGKTARQVNKPVPLAKVLQQAMAEIEDYGRVSIEFPHPGDLVPGHAGPDVILLVAELLENATRFSKSSTTVVMRTAQAPEGLAIEIDDAGLSMPAPRMVAMNRLLAEPHTADVRQHMRDGQIGLLVGGLLASRHGLTVRLAPGTGGCGTRARVVLPGALLIAAPSPAGSSSAAQPPVSSLARVDEVDAAAARTPPPVGGSGDGPSSAAAPQVPPGGVGPPVGPPVGRYRSVDADRRAGSDQTVVTQAAAGRARDDQLPALPRRGAGPAAAPQPPGRQQQEAASESAARAAPGLMACFTEGVRRSAQADADDTDHPARPPD